jgi:hypothetical protein
MCNSHCLENTNIKLPLFLEEKEENNLLDFPLLPFDSESNSHAWAPLSIQRTCPFHFNPLFNYKLLFGHINFFSFHASRSQFFMQKLLSVYPSQLFIYPYPNPYLSFLSNRLYSFAYRKSENFPPLPALYNHPSILPDSVSKPNQCTI